MMHLIHYKFCCLTQVNVACENLAVFGKIPAYFGDCMNAFSWFNLVFWILFDVNSCFLVPSWSDFSLQTTLLAPNFHSSRDQTFIFSPISKVRAPEREYLMIIEG